VFAHATHRVWRVYAANPMRVALPVSSPSRAESRSDWTHELGQKKNKETESGFPGFVSELYITHICVICIHQTAPPHYEGDSQNITRVIHRRAYKYICIKFVYGLHSSVAVYRYQLVQTAALNPGPKSEFSAACTYTWKLSCEMMFV